MWSSQSATDSGVHLIEELDDSEFEYDGPSRSQVKRDMLALQKLGERICELSQSDFKRLPLSDTMVDAVAEMRRISSNTARRRHLRRLGKLLREEQLEIIHAFFDESDNQHQNSTQHFHALEQWRDRLIKEGDAAISTFMQEYPEADRQQLRQLVRKAQKEVAEEKPPAASRKLFKVLRTAAEG